MMPLTLVPPAQAEALYDAQDQTQIEDRFAPMAWLDDDYSEDDRRTQVVLIADSLHRDRHYSRLQAA